LPLTGESFDLVCSWNSFEHVGNPQAALAELLRLCKIGGHVYLAFNPLWCSPLGLHALGFNMPYPQFLFSDELIEEKFKQFPNGDTAASQDAVPQEHWSAGKKHMDLMNKLRVEYFRALWKNSGCELTLLTETKNNRYLNVIANFPRAFSGRGLTLDDVTTDGVEVLLAKK
jgi:SAM-dependent methyltransferase